MAAASSTRSMPTGHQVMHRPQPTQPDGVELVPPGRQLVGEPLAVPASAPWRARGPPWSSEWSRVKHESHLRVRSDLACRPGRWCPPPWCRSRWGTPGCSCRTTGSAGRPRPTGDGPAPRRAPRRDRRSAGAAPWRPSPGRSPRRQRPDRRRWPADRGARRAATGRVRSGRGQTNSWRPGPTSSVRRTSGTTSPPRPSATGPVPMEVQKHVAAGSPQSTDTSTAPLRRCRYVGVRVLAAEHHPVLHGQIPARSQAFSPTRAIGAGGSGGAAVRTCTGVPSSRRSTSPRHNSLRGGRKWTLGRVGPDGVTEQRAVVAFTGAGSDRGPARRPTPRAGPPLHRPHPTRSPRRATTGACTR